VCRPRWRESEDGSERDGQTRNNWRVGAGCRDSAGRTTATSCLAQPALWEELQPTSARPPVLQNGKPSEATKRILIQGFGLAKLRICTLPKQRTKRQATRTWLCYNCNFHGQTRLGQHFLHDCGMARTDRARNSRVAVIAPERHEERPYCWIEIGAGQGEMTEHLACDRGAVYTRSELRSRCWSSKLQRLATRHPNLTVMPRRRAGNRPGGDRGREPHQTVRKFAVLHYVARFCIGFSRAPT
jgi:hypothetical protein